MNRIALLHDATLIDEYHARRDLPREVHFVGYDQHSHSTPREIAHHRQP